MWLDVHVDEQVAIPAAPSAGVAALRDAQTRSVASSRRDVNGQRLAPYESPVRAAHLASLKALTARAPL